MLEDGLLSIHSCAIVWEAVVICHYLAIRDTSNLRSYTTVLAKYAQDAAENTFSILQWLDENILRLPGNGNGNISFTS